MSFNIYWVHAVLYHIAGGFIMQDPAGIDAWLRSVNYGHRVIVIAEVRVDSVGAWTGSDLPCDARLQVYFSLLSREDRHPWILKFIIYELPILAASKENVILTWSRLFHGVTHERVIKSLPLFRHCYSSGWFIPRRYHPSVLILCTLIVFAWPRVSLSEVNKHYQHNNYDNIIILTWPILMISFQSELSIMLFYGFRISIIGSRARDRLV
jgi:hypothetical protein